MRNLHNDQFFTPSRRWEVCGDMMSQTSVPSSASTGYFLAMGKLLLLLLLSEVITNVGGSVGASPQTWRYFNPDSQATLRFMLSNWACICTSAMWTTKRWFQSIACPNFCVAFWTGARHNCISKNFPPLY